MSLEIKTATVEKVRETYSYLARRYGKDKPASRYDEVSFDLQPSANFHYRPLWRPEFELYDPRLTSIVMSDWDALRDPRQYYYAPYNIARAGMIDGAQKSLKLVEEMDLLAQMSAEWREAAISYLGPARHLEWGANMNCYQIAADGYGVAVTAPAAFCAHDHLGMAQLVTGILLVLDPGETLINRAKEEWLGAPAWQGVRHMVEDSFVLEDWFELFVAQNLAFDGIVYPLLYDHFDREGRAHGASGISLVTQFMRDWNAENIRWVDAVIKRAAQESPENAQRLSGWARAWMARSLEAATPLASRVLGAQGEDVIAQVTVALKARAAKLGLEV